MAHNSDPDKNVNVPVKTLSREDETGKHSPVALSLGEQMREGMRRLASGVCVVSASYAGKRYAMTASSVTSVSDDPASLLICVNKQARFSEPMSSQRFFSVSLLSAAHQAISNLCAIPNEEEERFSQGSWEQDEQTGLYYLHDAQAAFFCEKVKDVEHGTHTIYIGNINKVLTSSELVNPLIYLDGRYLD